jgi:hypothetical protein
MQRTADTVEVSSVAVDQAVQDKMSTIIRAQGEAKSAELIGQAIAQCVSLRADLCIAS